MWASNSDKEWEKYGKNEPYFGVLTDEKYRRSSLSEKNKAQFFQSGRDHVAHVLETVKRHVDPSFKIRSAVDFGCGVGRLVMPLAELSESVVGIDVSPSMLEEAKNNCKQKGLDNVRFIHSTGAVPEMSEAVNFIHSFIVFQHIPVNRGFAVFDRLLTNLTTQGVGVFHFTYDKDAQYKKVVPWLKRYIPFAKYLFNLAGGRSVFAPQMQMNSYNLNRVFATLQKAGVSGVHVEYTDHGGELGVIVYFQKT